MLGVIDQSPLWHRICIKTLGARERIWGSVSFGRIDHEEQRIKDINILVCSELSERIRCQKGTERSLVDDQRVRAAGRESEGLRPRDLGRVARDRHGLLPACEEDGDGRRTEEEAAIGRRDGAECEASRVVRLVAFGSVRRTLRRVGTVRARTVRCRPGLLAGVPRGSAPVGHDPGISRGVTDRSLHRSGDPFRLDRPGSSRRCRIPRLLRGACEPLSDSCASWSRLPGEPRREITRNAASARSESGIMPPIAGPSVTPVIRLPGISCTDLLI